MPRHPGHTPIEQRHRIGGHPGQRDHRLDLLLTTGAFYAQTNNCGLDHTRVVVQHLFEFVTGDILSSPSNPILQPIDEMEAALAIQTPSIACVEPQVAPRFNRFLGHLEIPDVETERRLRANENLADLVGC